MTFRSNPEVFTIFKQDRTDVCAYRHSLSKLFSNASPDNDTNAEFQRPDHYIRYIEPLESELAVQVEYDMDEQDQAWLEALNADRKKEQLDKISYETFEIIMDRLEKEWFDLTKNIPKSDFALPSEDSTCAICDDSEGENTNAIVFCDGCNLAVHQDCYGVPYIPEGQWLCRKCTVFPESPVSCILCPNEGGAFKQTVQGEWVHLLCAIWVPETRVANEVFMEPVTGVERISKQRWRLKCEVCGVREGACIQCNKTSCFLAFHATCARKERLLMPMKATQGLEAPTLACFCEKHLPAEQTEIRAAAFEAEQNAADEEMEGEIAGTKSPKSSKAARAYAKTYKPGPPIVPYVIVRRIMQYIGKINIRHKEKFVLLVCKYWSLKREVRRGAPLLKRLHLEPWTANTSGRNHTEEDKAIKLEFLKRLKDDLERVRVLTQTTRKREAQKLRGVEAIRDVLSLIIFPHEAPLRMAFERIMGADRQDFFKNPVSKVDVPDYYDVIKNPMCWNNIDQKLDAHEYWDLQEFKNDVNLVLANAMLYNAKTTTFYKVAERIQNTANTILADLETKLNKRHLELDPSNTVLEDSPSADGTSEPVLGNLEPPLSLLKLLAVEDTIKDDINLILSSPPVDSLFSYEFPVHKPPPPPPPRKPKKSHHRSEQSEAKRRERLSGNDSGPGFRAPRTRHAKAQAAAFEAEANLGTPAPVPVPVPVPVPTGTSPPPDYVEGEASGARRHHKKPKIVLPGQTEEMPMVQDVDNQDSFKMFDGGWVLPPERRRGNRPPIEKRPTPPPRRRHKAEREKSHLSAYSTSVVDNETLPTPSIPTLELPDSGPIAAAEPPGAELEVQDKMDVDHDAAADVRDEAEVEVVAEVEVEATHIEAEAEAEVEVVATDEAEAEAMPTEVEVIVTDEAAQAAAPSPISSDNEEVDVHQTDVEDIARPTIEVETSPEHDDLPSFTAEEDEPMDTSHSADAIDLGPTYFADAEEIAQMLETSPGGEVPDASLVVGEEEPMDVEDSVEVHQIRRLRSPDATGIARTPPEMSPVEVVVELPPSAGDEPEVETANDESEAEAVDDEPDATNEEAEPTEEQEQDAPESEDDEPEEPRKIIYIDVLDTPLTRREKNRLRKEERMQLALSQANTAAALGPVTGPSTQREAAVDDDHMADEDEAAPSDLSELSDLSDGEQEEQDEPKPPPRPVGAVKIREDGTIEGGTLVWAKLKSWPWWPAVVFEIDDVEIPTKILREGQNSTGPPRYPIRFYDKRRNWQWLEESKLLELGEDTELDEDMLAPNSRRQKWKNVNDRQSCRAAFREATEEMERVF
ncbi:hypothetical protein EUX98_g6973 [Antrodiella citrinella]|uniref:Histone acetyltransferase n=1 Tax=Antrodiella citrinella TaxID=2447956 RepID=A0A4S4MQ65_9APHY|nr:hypothetical protein EUX98_g6973 [Antrodiella citrinella]